MSKTIKGVAVPDDAVCAFPLHATSPSPDGGVVHITCAGMLLRDWFAGQALASVLSAELPLGVPNAADVAAKVAYAVADAMMRARGGE